MPALRDIALTVEERQPDHYFWVLLEASTSDSAEEIHYSPIQTAATPQGSYASALVMGANALRKLMESGAQRIV